MTDTTAKTAETAANAAQDAVKKKWAGLGEADGWMGKLAKNGGANLDAAKKTVGENFKWAEGNKGKVAFRSGSAAIGVAMMADAAFRGKKGDGEERGGVGRFVEFVVGGGTTAAALLGGRAV